jgi:kumamolisin
VIGNSSSDLYVNGTNRTHLYHFGYETAWNDFGATGGGVSQKFDVPDFQASDELPADANKNGRIGCGDPDIAGNPTPQDAYTVRVGGAETVIGGTSALAPLYSALMMRVNGALGHSVGYSTRLRD